MVTKRSSNCPLCGAKLTAVELLDTCTELIDSQLGVLEAHCPYCQGYLEVVPAVGRVDIGYLFGTDPKCFNLAHSLPYEGLEVMRAKDMNCVMIKAPGRSWNFSE